MVLRRAAPETGKDPQAFSIASDARTFRLNGGRLLSTAQTLGPGQVVMKSAAPKNLGEQTVIDDLTALHGIVLATGGGAVLLPENREVLKSRGFVVYLYCSIDKILHRTRHDTQRPLLQTANPRKRLKELLAQREPLYKECADFKIDSGSMPGKSVVKTILQHYRAALEEHERIES